MKRNRFAAAALAVLLAFSVLFAGCGTEQVTLSAESSEVSEVEKTETSEAPESTAPEVSEEIPEDAVTITLSDSGCTTDGSEDAVKIEGTDVKIKEAGSYCLSGEMNGQITVKAGEGSAVALYLNGVSVTCEDSSPLLIKEGLVTLVLTEGSENSFTDGEIYNDEDENLTGAVYSKEDLTLTGTGSLTVNANHQHGIVSKDVLTVESGCLQVTAVTNGLRGKEGVLISGGEITLNSGEDGIKSANAEAEGTGDVLISGGSIEITSGGDGISAAADLTVTDGAITVLAGDGYENGEEHSEGGMGGFGGFGGFGTDSDESDSDSVSCKGLKATGTLTVSGGELTVDSADDALHSAGDMLVSGGTLDLKSGDDGLHSDAILTISDGKISIANSYEGLEGTSVLISGGTTELTASDDGINAAGGNDSSGFGGMFGDMFGSGDYSVEISGGVLVIDASGDGIDSNGSLILSGGLVLVSGPVDSANGALDYATQAEVSGGTLLAVGAVGMAENFTSGTQCAVLTRCTCTAGEQMTVCDAEGNVLYSAVPAKGGDCFVFTSPDLTVGETYTVYTGGTVSGGTETCGITVGGTLTEGTQLTAFEQTDTLTGSNGMSMGMGMGGNGGGGMQGGRQGGQQPQMPDGDNGDVPEKPDGEMQGGDAPEKPDGEMSDREDMTPPGGTEKPGI